MCPKISTRPQADGARIARLRPKNQRRRNGRDHVGVREMRDAPALLTGASLSTARSGGLAVEDDRHLVQSLPSDLATPQAARLVREPRYRRRSVTSPAAAAGKT